MGLLVDFEPVCDCLKESFHCLTLFAHCVLYMKIDNLPALPQEKGMKVQTIAKKLEL